MNPLFIFLQAAAEAADSTEVSTFESAAKQTVEYFTTTPSSEIWSSFLHNALTFGLKVVAALVIYFVGAWLIKLIKKLLKKVFEKRSTEKAVASFVTSLVSITLTVLLIIITIGALGINTTSLAALLAAGGMALGLALNGTVQNFAGGIMILIFKPFRDGDYISAAGYSGTVTKMSIVSTTITTVDNRAIVIPNGTLFGAAVDNYSSNELRRVDWTVGVSYGSDSAKVIEVLKGIVDADPRVLTTATGAPADPFIALSSLDDSAITFTVRVWVKQADYWGVFFDGNKNIYEELPKKGIEFPFPQMDVHVKKD